MTAQVHEKIRYQGKRMQLATTPHFPEDHPRKKCLTDKEFWEGNHPEIIGSTACWREYIGSWSIRRGKFYLTNIEGRFRLGGKEAIFADWVTGELRIPKGKMLDYIHIGFDSVYEDEIVLTVEQGVVINTETVKPPPGIGYSELINPCGDL